MKTIGLASDHAGFELKEYVKTYLTEKGIEFIDYGTDSTASIGKCRRERRLLSGNCHLR